MSLEAENIEAHPVWKPLFEGCKFYQYADDRIRLSERLIAEGLCLLSGANMTVEEQEKVIAILQKHLSRTSDTLVKLNK